jgi:hypothetical protein
VASTRSRARSSSVNLPGMSMSRAVILLPFFLHSSFTYPFCLEAFHVPPNRLVGMVADLTDRVCSYRRLPRGDVSGRSTTFDGRGEVGEQLGDVVHAVLVLRPRHVSPGRDT